MRWDTIFFDLDDTLLSYEETFKKAIKYTFLKFRKEWGICETVNEDLWFAVFKRYSNLLWIKYEKSEWTKEQYRFKRFYDTMKEFQFEANEEMAMKFHHYFDQIVSKFAIPIDGIEKLLIELKENEKQLGIITNGKKNTQMEKIYTLGFQRFFADNAIVISEDVFVEKPSPKIFEAALKRLDSYIFPPLYIGDSWEMDIVGANNAHWDVIYFNTQNQQKGQEISVVDICTNVKELQQSIFFFNHGGRK